MKEEIKKEVAETVTETITEKKKKTFQLNDFLTIALIVESVVGTIVMLVNSLK